MKLVQSALVWLLGRGLTACLLLWLIPATTLRCSGQGTLQITFDGPPLQPPGSQYSVTNYYESGMYFRPIGYGFFSRAGEGRSSAPQNGGTYIKSAGDPVVFSFTNGLIFDLRFVDIAEYGTGQAYPLTVRFVGYRANGSMVTETRTTDGIIDGTGPLQDFEPFRFGTEWTGLTRVEIPTYGWSLDNLVVSIPEPNTGALLVLGAALLGFGRYTRMRKRL